MKQIFSRRAWQLRVSRRLLPWMRADWPRRMRKAGPRPRVAVVTVNYNTKELLARLIFSLRRIVDDSVVLGPIVVVDNRSTDGSVPFLELLAEAGAIEAFLNDRQKYHGPGLNQGIDFLRAQAARKRPGFDDIDFVFVVDSDVFITRGEIFSAAIGAMKAVDSSMAGEFVPNEYIAGGDAHVSSLLFDPAVCWRRGLHPFEEHGAPALEFQRSMVRRGLVRLDFPFRNHLYLVHLLSGTMKAICAQEDRGNKYFEWAAAHITSESLHPAKVESVVEEFEQRFRSEVSEWELSRVVAACLAPGRIRLSGPYDLAPPARFVPKGEVSADGYVVR
jgi:hypothetical protein